MLPARFADKNVQTLGVVLEPETLLQIWRGVVVRHHGSSAFNIQPHRGRTAQLSSFPGAGSVTTCDPPSIFLCCGITLAHLFKKQELSINKKSLSGMILQTSTVFTETSTATYRLPVAFIFPWAKSSTNTRTMITKACYF